MVQSVGFGYLFPLKLAKPFYSQLLCELFIIRYPGFHSGKVGIVVKVVLMRPWVMQGILLLPVLRIINQKACTLNRNYVMFQYFTTQTVDTSVAKNKILVPVSGVLCPSE